MASKEEAVYINQLAAKAPSLKDIDSMTPQEEILAKNIIKNFININNLIVYGGNALNAILPPEDRFYKPDEFSDYDILSPTAKEHAKALADIFYEHGFTYTEVVPAMHDGTYKVLINFKHIADITNTSADFFNEMLKLSKQERKYHKYLDKSSTLNIAPIYLVKHFIIVEMAWPKTSLYRWPKVYNRLALLNKHYNPDIQFGPTPYKSTPKDSIEKLCKLSKYPTIPPEVPDIFEKVLDIIKVHKLPLIGNFAVGLHLGKNYKQDVGFVRECCRLDDFFSVFEIMSQDPKSTFELISSFLTPMMPNCKLTTAKRFYYDEIMPERLRVYLDVTTPQSPKPIRISLLTIVEIKDRCYSTTDIHGLTVGTPYTILSFLYAYYLVYRVFESLKIAKHVEQMIKLLETYVETKLTLKEKFVTECFGQEKSLLSVKKEIFINPSQRYLYRPHDKTIQSQKNFQQSSKNARKN